MARKKKKARVRPRPLPPPGQVARGASAGSAAVSTRQQRVGGGQALVRAVEMSLGGQAVIRGRGRARYVLESGDPGIPLDRVPYFTSDLVRLAIVGAVMVVLLLASNFVLAQLLK